MAVRLARTECGGLKEKFRTEKDNGYQPISGASVML